MISWQIFFRFFPKVVSKFPVTLSIVLVAFSCGILLGVCFALVRLKKIPVLRQIVTLLVSYIRCTPILTQMFVVYFGMPALLHAMGFHTAGIPNVVYVFIAYGLNQAGFLSEIIRSSILAVPAGQTEAGRAAGLTEAQTLFHIVMPQALRVAMPMLGTTFVFLFQATALAYMVGVVDMIGKANSLSGIYGHTLEGYLCAAVVFAVISLVLEHVFQYVNRRLDFGRTARRGKKVKPA